jgi:hypothetical protein
MRRLVALALALSVSFFVLEREPEAATRTSAPVSCSRGASAVFEINAVVPETAAEGATYVVRIDGTPSGKISQTGLYSLRDITFEYALPSGATYVDGSARIVPGTGSDNVRDGARVSFANNVLTLTLPTRVPNGGSYQPPSIEAKLKAASPPATLLPVTFSRYRVRANVVLLGDIDASCVPTRPPFTVGSTRVIAASN